MNPKFSCVYAHESRDCGPAALATVARAYGVRLSLERLRYLAGVDSQGTDIKALAFAAESVGFSASCGRAKSGAFEHIPLPAIAHIHMEGDGHFVVIHQIHPDSVVVADPSVGIQTLARSAFEKKWTGHLLLLQPLDSLYSSPREKSVVRTIVELVKQEKLAFIQAFVLTVIVAALAIGMPILVQKMFDRALPAANLSLGRKLGIGLALVVFVRAAFFLIRSQLLMTLGKRLECSVAQNYWQHLLWLPTDFFDRRHPGDLVARVSDASNVRVLMTNTLLAFGFDLSFLLASAFVLFRYNKTLTLSALGCVPFICLGQSFFHRSLINKHWETKKAYSKLFSAMVDVAGNIKTVKMFGLERITLERVMYRYNLVLDLGCKANLLMSAAGGVGSTISGITLVFLVLAGLYLISSQKLTIGEWLVFYTVAATFLASMERLSPTFAVLHEACVSIQRLNDIHAVQIEGTSALCDVSTPRGREDIVLDGVGFFHKQGFDLFHNLSMRIDAGDTVAITGQTGCGKSTLAALIAGLYKPTYGKVTVAGMDTRSCDPKSIRSIIAIVFQEAGLFATSIYDNIACGNYSATREEIFEVANLACAHEFIMKHPRGYDFELGASGGGVSGGQRQRIAIARALLRNPPILILDEATSSLDIETEDRVITNILYARRGRTTIIVSHRPANVVRASRVFELSQNGLVATSVGLPDRRSLMQ